MQLERLEDRCLLDGAQLIGIQPNDGALLEDGEIRNVAPTDLTFRFDENQIIDSASLGDTSTPGGIQITRSNLDGVFAPASLRTDFGTGGLVEIEFAAVRLGRDQNGITLTITKSDFGGPGLPGISVLGRNININLNVNAGNQTTAADLVNAIANSVDASNLVTAAIAGGTGTPREAVNIADPAPANTAIALGDPASVSNPIVTQVHESNDIVVLPGFIGVGEPPALNEVVFRFAGRLPDDTYRIDVFGTGHAPLRNVNNELYLDGQNSHLQFELDLAPQVISVVPEPVVRKADGSLVQDRDKVIVFFNDDDLFVQNDAFGQPTARSAENPNFYQLIYTSETVENTDDVIVNPIDVKYDAQKDMAVLTFAYDASSDRFLDPSTLTPLGPGTFRLRIGTDETTPAPPTVETPTSEATATFNGVDVNFLAKGEKWGEAIRIEVIESDHGDDSLPKVDVLDNVITVDLNTNADAGNVNSPSTAGQLVDAINNHFNAGSLVVASIVNGAPGTTITGTAYPTLTLTGLGSSFDTATRLGDVTAQNRIIRGEIEPQVYALQLPGGNDDPGHRAISVRHVPDDSANRNISYAGDRFVEMGITRLEYNFRQDMGVLPDAQGNDQPAFNVMTETQKRRAREAFQILSEVTGVEFVETERDGLIVASGDPNTVNRDGQPLLVLDVDLDDRFNSTGGWFRTLLSRVTGLLGLGTTADLPGQAIRGSDADLNFDNPLEPTVLSDNDVVHLQHLYYPESKDIDMFRFQVPEASGSGKLTIETFAERQPQSSLLDTALTLYRENDDGSRRLLTRNDNYFSRDSYLEMDVEPGVYYVGVSAAGNDEYDPTIEDTGFGGTTQGEYELRFNFRPDVDAAILDADNPNDAPTFLDGDADGVPGGVYNFWFRAAPLATAADVTPPLPPRTQPRTFFVDKSVGNGLPATSGTGTIDSPFNNLQVAFGPATPVQPGDIVRIVGNPGDDNDVRTLDDNRAFQVGFDSLGRPLPDGPTMEVPKGVTVMVDGGAIFQMRRARIGVGSSAPGIDRSAGALQVIGAPFLLADNGNETIDAADSAVLLDNGQRLSGSAYFTSYNDQQIGLDTNPLGGDPAPGDWGGLLFRDDIDRAQGNFVYDEEGIFLNYVNHADIRYGGGNVLINSVATVVNPIHVTDTRPTITFNTITRSADAAISASPDSFEETNFHAPRHQRIAFTSDYDRIGPDVYGNTLVDNSINGLFVRVATEAGSIAQKLHVSGRWDDTDIVHVLAENHAVASQPGGRMELVTAPPIRLITRDLATGGTLGAVGVTTEYTYKLVDVDRFGYEGPASSTLPTMKVEPADVAANRQSIRLGQLPPASDGFVARRLYRSTNNGPFELVAQLNGKDTVFVDDGTTRGGILHVPPVRDVTLSGQLGGTLVEGTYRYRMTYVDSLGKESRASDATAAVAIDGNPNAFGLPGKGTILLDNLPAPDASGHFVARRIYRSVDVGDGNGFGPFRLAAEIDAASSAYLDAGASDPGTVLDEALVVPRQDGRLAIDPSMVVKLDGARFEIELGAQMIAEGGDGREIIFTSMADDRFGAGGTFDTGNDGPIVVGGANEPQAGDWGGVYTGHLSRLNVDHALFAYGGGVTRVEGTFTAFNVVEIHDEAEARIANSVFEFNARGQGGQGEANRFGRGPNEPGVIFVRQAQPIIYNNIFRNNPDGDPNNLNDTDPTNDITDPNRSVPAININVNALNHILKRDTGRTTGPIDRVEGYRDNQGPLILDNRMEQNGLNGMLVRGQTLTTESVWDDTDIVHIVLDTIYVPDFHTFGGLTLASSPTESLVVKLLNDPAGATQAGFVATGIPHEIDDRIGGIIQVLGQPGSPVVLTSLRDDTRGAGSRPDGDPQVDTNGDGSATSPQPGDWNSVRLDRFSHDRNVELFYEFEPRDVNSPGPNGTPDEAQLLGMLAPSEYAGDENRRLGFTVKGFLNDPQDIDVYSFEAIPGTEVWVDVDRSTYAFDPVVELLDAQGTVVARSNNSPDELKNANNFLEPADRTAANLTPRELNDPSLLVGEARPMLKTPQIPKTDFYTTNPRDAGMRLLLPGIPDPNNPERPLTYHVRVRSGSPDLDNLSGGLTSGAYELQIRLREMQEIPGSTVRFALIGYATNGVELFGQPVHSPLTGESTESSANNDSFANAQGIGNLLNSDRGAISVAGRLGPTSTDVDFYQFDVNYLDPDTLVDSFETVFDVDYANGLGGRPNASIHVFDTNGRLILTSRDSNIAEDRPSKPGSSDLDDLSRGSVGATDPYIGVVDLSSSRAVAPYTVAVSADGQMPAELDQFFQANATNPDVRLEPIQSVRRVAEDHIDFQGGSTADPPQTSVLFDTNAEVPYHLGDVVLFLSRDQGVPGDVTSTTLLTVDPFTGAQETLVGAFGQETGDIAMHPRGTLYAYRLSKNEPIPCVPRDELSGNFYGIDPGDASATFITDDNIETYRVDPADSTKSILTNFCSATNSQVGDGIEFNAMTVWSNQDGFAVGDRGFAGSPNLMPGVEIAKNVLYHFDADPTSPSFGKATSSPQADRADDAKIPETKYLGAGTQIRERGELLTSPRIEAIYATRATGSSSVSNLKDGDTFTVIDRANRTTFEFDTGPEVQQNISPRTDQSIRDGYFFQLDDNLFQFDTGSVIRITGGGTAARGNVVTVNDIQGISRSYEFIFANDPRGDPTATPITIGPATTALQVAGSLAAAINADGAFVDPAGNRTIRAHAPGTRVSLEGDTLVQLSVGSTGLDVVGDTGPAPILQAVDGSQIADGEDFFISSGGNLQQFEFESGYTIHTPVRYMFELPASGGRAIQDGENFRITNISTGADVTFEFDRDGFTTVTDPDHVIPFLPVETADQIATTIVNVIGNAALNLNLAPSNLGGGLVHLGSTGDNTLDASNAPSLVQTGQAAGIGDGEMFTISNGLGTTVTFEFDDDGIFVDANLDGIPDNTLITFTQADTHDDIADRIATAVSMAGLSLGMPSKGWLPANIGNGNIWIGGDDGIPIGAGTPIHSLDTFSAAPSIGQTGDPGVSDLSVVEIPYIPAVTFTADMVAEEISNAVLAAGQSTTTIQVLDGDNYSDGQTLAVNDVNGTIVLEFEDSRNGPAGVTPGNVPVLFDPGVPAVGNQQGTPAELAAVIAPRIAFGINSAANNVSAAVGVGARVVVSRYGVDLTTFHPVGSDRVVVNGENISFAPGTSQILDLTSSVLGVTLIDVEESYDVLASDPVRAAQVPPAPGTRNLTDHFIATRVADVVGSHVDYQASGAGGAFSRVNFPDARTADFSGVPVWTEIAASGFGVASGNERIPLLADDQPTDHFVDFNLDGTADDLNANGVTGQIGLPPAGDQVAGLARKISDAINVSLGQTFGISATSLGRFVRLNRGSVQNNSGLITAGEGPGGTITGITRLGGTLWAVSDAGGLFRVNGPFAPNATTTYIATSQDDLLGIPFSGLTAGPPNVERGRYANMLFASDAAGTLYAFDTAGVLQPVFVDGKTSVSTGPHPTQVRGLEFSTLDENLFHVTPPAPYSRGATPMDVRLGIAAQVGDPIVVDEHQGDGGHGIYANGNQVGVSPQSYAFGQGNVAGTPRSYDFPGGALGSIVSNEFSLKGYSAADRPTLYFSYWLDTENVNGPNMRDALRVFIAGDDGDWQLLSTNNTYGPELSLPPFDVQEAFDEKPFDRDWRQVRVPLDPYAGRENLRLRIDFSTSADMDMGDPGTTGDEIRAVAGVFVKDGDTMVIDNQTIEWDSGLTVVAPTGSAIQTGEQITITDQLDNPAILQFVDNVLTLSDIIATDGSRLNDGDTFQIDDQTATATFEFDSGYILEVPPAGGGGIADQETFVVDFDGAGINPPVTYEFDKNGVFIDVAPPVGPGQEDNSIINIADNLTIVAPAAGGAAIGDQESFNLSDGVTTFTFEFDKNANTIPGRLPVNVIDNWAILLPAAGGGFGGVADGDTFTIDPDGAGIVPPLVFEFDRDGANSGDEVIPVDHFTTQDVLADSVVLAVNNQAGTLGLTAKNVGGGRVVLDGTTILHNLDTSGAPSVGQARVPLTQDELAERIITALDLADSTPIADGTVLGLSLPSVAAGEVVNGNIVLGGTTPSHSLDTGGSPGLTQTTTPRSPEEIADRIANAINADFGGTTLRAAALDGGRVNVLDLIGGVIHTVDASGAPGLTLRGTPAVAPGNHPISFLPTDTLDEIIDGGLPIVPGALPRPGLIAAIEDPTIGLNVDAQRLPFPNEEIVTLTGTAGNTVTFSPGVTALEPRGVIPILVDDSQTANDVAERIALGIRQAVARGDLVAVTPHLNGDLGYESPSVPPGEVRINRVNVEGASSIVVNPTSLLKVEGDVGVAVGNLPVPFHTDMNRDQVATALDGALENFYHNPTIITDTGLQFRDGDTFVLDDGLNAPVTYEFDHGYILNIPSGGGMVSAGGISDGESFTITDLSGTISATFEYDKNGAVMPGSTPIAIKENDSALGVAKVTMQEIQSHPLRSALGLTPRLLTGNRLQLGGQVGTTLTLTPGGVLTQAPGTPGVGPAVTIRLPQTLGVQLPDPLTIHIPAGGLEDGETFVIDDGSIPPVTFEFEDTTFGDGVTPGNQQVNFSPASSQEEIGRDIVTAIAGSGLNVQATMLGGTGNIDLGGGANYVLTLPPGSPLLQTGPLSLQAPGTGGAGITDGDQFFIDDGPLQYVFEFEDTSLPPGDPGIGVSPGALQIDYDPNDSQDVIADLIVLRLQNTPGLNLDPIKTTGPARVHLGSVAYDTNPSTNVTVDTSQTHLTETGRHDQLQDGQVFVISDGATPVPTTVQFELDTDGTVNPANAIIDVAPGSTPHQIASEIVHEIEGAGLGLNPANEHNGRIHIGGTASHQLDTSQIPSLSQFGSGGPIPDGQTFIISEAAKGVTFEFDKDGNVSRNNAGNENISINFTDADSTDTVAQRTIAAMSSIVSGLNIFPRYLGNGVIDVGGNQNHVVTLTSSLKPLGAMSLQVPQAGGGIAGVVDGETFTITDLATSTGFVFEFDNDGAFVDDVAPFGTPDNILIPFAFSDTQNDIGHAMVQVVGGVTALGLTPTYDVGGVVNLNGNPLTHALSLGTTVLTTTGKPGAQTPHVAVAFSPSDDFSAADVAQAIQFSINNTLALNITASAGAAGTADQRRVELKHDTGFPTDITFTPDADGDLQLEAPNDIIKQDEDLVRIIGHDVVDPGPLGLDDALAGDQFGDFHSNLRGQNNRFEGVGLDNFIIGPAERGEEVQDANNGSTGFSTNPNIALGNTQGEYQLEIRGGPGLDSPLIAPPLSRSFQTNDRQGEGSTIVVQRGLDIADGQTFTVSDGVEHVVFEYVDTSIPDNQAQQGRIAVPFVPSDEDYAIAQRVRDAINSSDAQAVLDVTASLSDGTLQGTGSPAASTSARVNLFGPVTLEVHATDVEETNDTIAEATATGIVGVDSPAFLGDGYIGDNPNFPLHPGFDVDLFQVSLSAGETLRVDIDANEIGSDLDAVLRIFDRFGNVVAENDDASAPGELPGRYDPFIEFTPLFSGTYYIGVSGIDPNDSGYPLAFSADGDKSNDFNDNSNYDPNEEGSGFESGTTGFYQIEITFGASTGNDFVLYDETGDPNQFRDQGQILIHANTILSSSGFGILAGPGARDGQNGDIPHAGPVRNTPKLNQQGLTTGVVIANNVLAFNQTGGISFSGDPNAIAGGQIAPVPFGRIINNTIYGGVDTAPTGGVTPVTYNGILFSGGDASFADTVVSYDPLFSGGPAPTASYRLNPASAVGPPDGDPALQGRDGSGVALGNGGQIVLQFTDNVLTPSGDALPDLAIFEEGQNAEESRIEISQDGATWIDVGTAAGGTTGIDIDAFGVAVGDQFPFVRITDDPNQGPNSGPEVGADINAVGAISTVVTSVSAGVGIRVADNASPTILNNIVADLQTGIEIVDTGSSSTVVGGSVYQDIPSNRRLVSATPITEDFPLPLSLVDPLFRNSSTGNFYLAAQSPAIDSSIDSLLERFDIKQVKNLIGIWDSPILAPDTDVTGQLRVDDPDVETPAGFGENVFTDRGAIDRADFVGPTATAVSPRDNDADGLDQNPAPTAIELAAGSILSSFRTHLSDGVPPADSALGSGVDDTTVISSNVTVSRDGVPLTDGIDYSFSYNATSDTIVLTPISGIWKADSTYVVRVNNSDNFQVVAKPGAELNDGDSFAIRVGFTAAETFEFESGYMMQVPQTLALQVPEAGGSLGGIPDGATFTIQRALGAGALQTEVFEFDSNGQFIDNNGDGVPDNHVINYNVASTPEEIAEAMVTQILIANIGLSPRHVGGGLVHLGSTSAHSVDVSRAPNLTRVGQASGVEDGDSFTVDDGTKLVTFEFDNDGLPADKDTDGQPDHPDAWANDTIIRFSAAQTHEEIADLVITAINVADLGLQPTAVGDGVIHLGGTPNVHQVNVSQSNLVLIGQPGVRSAWGIRIPTKAGLPRLADDGSGLPFISDGDTFSINDGRSSITFELDNLSDPVGGGFTTAPNTVITYRDTSTVDEIADRLVAAIQSAPLVGLTPVNIGNGVVLLGEPTDGTSTHTLDASQTGLVQVGNPGVAAAVPVTFRPHETFDGRQAAVSIIRAVNASSLDVTARPAGGDVVIIEGATMVSEINPVFVSNTFFGGVKDLAGNDLKPNLLSGETQTTIVLGNAAMDFGDAPQTAGGDYPTDLGQNGPIHMITDNPIFLGRRIDADGDGQVSAAADGDDLDSEGFVVDLPDPNPLPPAKPGPANVWLRNIATQNLVRNDTTPTIIELPQPLTLVVGDGSQILPGDQFGLGNDGQNATFEFIHGGSPTFPTNIPIVYDGTETVDQIADRVVAAVASRGELGLSPANLGNGTVHLGGDSLSVVAFGAGLARAGTANPIKDEEWFTIDADPGTGIAIYTFEFEDADEGDGVAPGHIPIPFDVSTTQDGYAQSVISAILGARLGIAATNFGNGQVELNGDDDDGVFMGAFNPLTETEIVVTASADGLLDAWIDFNIDGDFNDAGEQIFASQQLTQGENTFAVRPPSGTVTGTTVGRFRFSTNGGLRPTGLAADGEVEDYQVNILAGNPPVANNDAATFSEDEDGTTVAASVLANDFDADPGDQAILTVASYQTTSELGAAVWVDTSANAATKGTFTYDPRGSAILQGLDVGETMTDTFTYRAMDAMFLSAPGTVTITVTGANDAPTALDDVQVFTDQGTAIDVDVLANDNDPENHSLTIVAASGATGNVSVDTARNVVRYDPAGMFDHLDQGESDTDTFTYQIADGHGGTAVGTVAVTVSGLNDPPVAADDTAPVARTNEDTPNPSVDVLANDQDPEGKPITVTAVQTIGTRGIAAVNSPGTPGNTVAYDPNGKFESLAVGQTGIDIFKYVVRDPDGNSSMGTVTMTIDGVNDNPVATDDTGISVPRNGTVDIDVLANDTDIDQGDVLQVAVPLDLTNTLGLASINADGTVKYDPNGMFDHLLIGQFAQDRFAYTVSDGNGGTATATVTVTVFGASDPPIATDDQATTSEDESVAIGVLFNDTDDFGPMTVTAVDQTGLKGSVVISPLNQPNNLVVYSPDGQFDTLAAGEQATETFTYTVSDGTGTDTGTVTVTVTGANDAPIANIDANGYTAERGRTLLAGDRDGSATPGVPGDDGVLLNDTDAEGDALTAGLIAGPQHAKVNGFTLFADGTFTYTHNGDSATTDTFQYVARDVHNAESQQVVTVVIRIVDAPAAEWQNPISRFDVNNDGAVSPIDVLLVINYINANLPDLVLPTPRPIGSPFYDVNGDGSATGLDVLEVIADINFRNQNQGAGEGESFAAAEGESAPAAVIHVPPGEIASPLADPSGQPVAAEPLSTSSNHAGEPVRGERPTLASRLVQSGRLRDRTVNEETIHVDPFGVEDALSAIAEEVGGSLAGRTALDDVLEELLG